MNWDEIKGRWNELSGQAKSKWGKLTDDDVQQVGGKKDALVGALQQRYGYLKDEAERAVDEWIAKIAPPPNKPA